MNGEAFDKDPELPKDRVAPAKVRLSPLLPLDNASPLAGGNVEFSWSKTEAAARYRLEVEDMRGKTVLTETLPRGVENHRVPSSQLDAPGNMRWRVVALDRTGNPLAETTWRTLLPLSSECEIW
jgi:hypothetical protein